MVAARALIGTVRRAWARISEPRVLRVLFWIGYAFTLYMGVVTLTNPPTTIEGVLGPVLSVSWALFWLVGGVTGMSTVLVGWWEIERYAVAASVVGVLIYGSVVFSLHFTSTGSRLTQLGPLGIALLFFAIRLVLIRGHDYEPRS